MIEITVNSSPLFIKSSQSIRTSAVICVYSYCSFSTIAVNKYEYNLKLKGVT